MTDDTAKTILLVDDSDLVAGVLTEFLTSAGYRVVRGRDGVEGIQMAYREIPDLIIMDVEMPLIQGYQASRLLKSRRGVRDIPIIMHTSLAEDKDKYWAFNSGVDAFINKDFDNLDRLKGEIGRLIQNDGIDRDLIREDGRTLHREGVFEMIGSVLDQQLFQSALVNLLGEAGKSIGSIPQTMERIFDILSKVCDYHVAAILIRYNRRPVAYIRPGEHLVRDDVDDFYHICLNDFHKHFAQLNLDNTRQMFLGIEDRKDFDRPRMDGGGISSYADFDIQGKGGTVIGSLHVGHLTNHYFSDYILNNIGVFAHCGGTIIENAILFNQISEMEDRVRKVFAKFVPGEIIDDLVERQTDESLMTGEKRRVAVLFSDIRSFTTISENNSAEAIVSFLNRYFSIMGGIIKAHGGTIDKFVGDAILAIFGAPTSYPDNGLRAVRAAEAMIQALDSVDTGDLVLPETGFEIGIGIHEGVAIVGNIGSADKFDYTVIGDTVNLASRLEGLTKHYQKRILVSEAVMESVSDQIFLREVDRVKVKGKETATSIYAVEQDAEAFDETFMDHYTKAMKLYKMGSWETAVSYFEQCRRSVPDDPITHTFLKRCREFRENPPANWDGALTLDFK